MKFHEHPPTAPATRDPVLGSLSLWGTISFEPSQLLSSTIARTWHVPWEADAVMTSLDRAGTDGKEENEGQAEGETERIFIKGSAVPVGL